MSVVGARNAASDRTGQLASELVRRSWTTASGAVVAELVEGLTAAVAFTRLAEVPGVLFLDSGLGGFGGPRDRGDEREAGGMPRPADAHGLARYSFLAADPLESIRCDGPGSPRQSREAMTELAAASARVAAPTIPGLPPFQGGYAGLISYDHGLGLLGLPQPAADPATPSLVMNLYDVVLAFDHLAGVAWLISQGFAHGGGVDGGPLRRRVRAMARADAMLERLARPAESMQTGSVSAVRRGRLPVSQGAPLPGHPGIVSTHSASTYEAMVLEAVELIRRGDIFQVNLAQRFAVASCPSAVELHLAAGRLNTAPFAACLDLNGVGLSAGDWIVSSSPERLVQLTAGSRQMARMHPIKGTRRVIHSPEADLFAGAELGGSDKDRAENVMIVDLVRNDLSRVCEPASVRVEALCRLERFAYVQHLVSIVAGRLRQGMDAVDCLTAVSPGGSVTGAPKQRACEIISALEGTARGPYCGSIGYLSCDGAADFNILIRSFVAADGCLTFSAGGGITVASDPADEYAESLHKAEGMLRVLEVVGGRAGAATAPGISRDARAPQAADRAGAV